MGREVHVNRLTSFVFAEPIAINSKLRLTSAPVELDKDLFTPGQCWQFTFQIYQPSSPVGVKASLQPWPFRTD